MKDLARKAMLLGIGVYAVTREKAEAVARDLLQKGEANENDVKKLAKKIEHEVKKKEQQIRKLVDKESSELMKRVERFANFRENKGKTKKAGKKKKRS